MTFNDIIDFFNEKNRSLQNKVRNTDDYKEYLNCNDLRRRNELVRKLNRIQYEEKEKIDKEICDYLIQHTTFKDNSPYICELSVEVKGQKLVFGGMYSLNGGDVSSMYRDWIKAKNEENKKSVVFNVGDIYVEGGDFYRIKKTTEKSVMVERLCKECVETDFNEEECRKIYLDDRNFKLEKDIFGLDISHYYFWEPKLKINCKERPSDIVEETYKMSVVFEKGKTILRNKSNGLEITEKWNGEDIISTHNSYTTDDSVNEIIEKIKDECEEKKIMMSEEYRKSPKGIEEEKKIEKEIQRREEENRKFNNKYEDIGVSKDLFVTSISVSDFVCSDNNTKKLECLEELKEDC